MSTATARLRGFDGLRAIAALSIVVLHVTASTGASVDGWFARYFARLDAGVAIFFVISAFLLYRPFLASHLRGRGSVDVGRFYWHHAIRIFPAYWVALTVVIVVFQSAHIRGAGQYVLHYGLVQIYTPKLLAGIIPAWTLAVEVSFYAVLPLYAWVLARMTAGRIASHAVVIELAGAAALLVSSLTSRAVLGAVDGTDTFRLKWLPFMADWFAFGLLLAIGAVAVEQGVAGRRLRAWVDAVDRSPTPVVVIGLAAFLATGHIGLPTTFEAGSVFQDVVRQILYGVMAACFVGVAAWRRSHEGVVRRGLDTRVMVLLGTISYGVFLWHYDILHQLIRWNFPDHVTTLTTPALLLCVFVVAVVAASVSWVLVERPLIRWSHKPTSQVSETKAAP